MKGDQDWGLTEKGFRCPTYVELLNALEYKARELFGAKAKLTVRSPLGIFLRIFAWILSILFQLTEDVYNSRFIDTAVGTSLYNLGPVYWRDWEIYPQRFSRAASYRIYLCHCY